VAAIPKTKVNKNEPWAGIWEVEGARYFIGQWGMKQHGKTVISTKDSIYKFMGEVKGNQLKGRIINEFSRSHRFVIRISSDGQSFEAKIDYGAGTVQMKGMRKQ
jgi:hypothetical protein